MSFGKRGMYHLCSVPGPVAAISSLPEYRDLKGPHRRGLLQSEEGLSGTAFQDRLDELESKSLSPKACDALCIISCHLLAALY